MSFYNLKSIKRYMYHWLNHYADRGNYIYSLAVIDIYPFKSKKGDKEPLKYIKFVKDIVAQY